jgi:hypothetical protein
MFRAYKWIKTGVQDEVTDEVGDEGTDE